jgi:hypothetical protein
MCTHTVDCSIRGLWESVQRGVDEVLSRTTLQTLLASESQPAPPTGGLIQISAPPTTTVQ